MNTYTVTKFFLIAVISACSGQHYQSAPLQPQPQYQPEPYVNRPPPPQILSHKQALNHDGNFKYVFTSENGIGQGESISPDGSRTGGYTYVDPNGKKISVKYTAGKEGFRVLEGDHLPKAPQPQYPLPAVAQQSSQQPFSGKYDDGQYRPEVHERPSQGPQYYSPSASYSQPKQYQPIVQASAPLSNEISREPQYHDEPGKPHSFGSGYIFEFAG